MESTQIEQIKKQLIQQIESTFPEDKKKEAIEKIQSMDENQLKEFLIQNNLINQDGTPTNQGTPQKCIFCSIIDQEIPTNKIDENDFAIAALEINPISKGHSLIIPKEHIEESSKMPKRALELAEKVTKRIKEKLKPKEVKIESINLFGHEILNLLPIYENENLNSKRKQAKPEELEELTKLLEVEKELKTIEKPEPKKIKAKKLWLSTRIP
jgi:histidine triad (HIT) family protein